MANALSGFRQKVSRVAELANAVKRLHDTGIIDLANLSVTLQTVKIRASTVRRRRWRSRAVANTRHRLRSSTSAGP